jgi:hypothetical protein
MNSTQLRALSCAGLLISPGSNGSKSCLWFIDLTGSYPVRAFCVGGGFQAGKSGTVADLVNGRLSRLDFSSLSATESFKKLVGLLKAESNDKENTETAQPLLKAGTRLEVAVVDSSSGQMKRDRIVSLSRVDS